ncbi:hypothetical protein BBI01_18145 [Chryseobacterium artocarpi]|uniref:Uncharacterized protein n=1 Tax=Chryseobacterium artocarpi TaxID=1414727 RepID=A0A1B8ZC00_9FLAO|nr:hypothetical protein BBI01_18145 [Chryseobacterium artocarpi]
MVKQYLSLNYLNFKYFINVIFNHDQKKEIGIDSQNLFNLTSLKLLKKKHYFVLEYCEKRKFIVFYAKTKKSKVNLKLSSPINYNNCIILTGKFFFKKRQTVFDIFILDKSVFLFIEEQLIEIKDSTQVLVKLSKRRTSVK